MSGHCPKCGDYTEEDESRLCSGCAKSVPLADMTDAMLAERVWAGDRWTYPNIASLRAKLAEAEKYGAPVEGAVALSFVKDPCKKHNAYWTTSSGSCMACRAADAEAKLAEWEAAGRVLAAEWNAINHLASCGDHSNGVEGDSGTDEGDYRACCEMERSAKAIAANPLASRLVAEAGGEHGD